MADIQASDLAGLLRQTGLFADSLVDEAVAACRNAEGAGIAECLARQGYAHEEAILEALGRVLGLPFLRNIPEPEKAALARLPTKAVFLYNVIPLSFQDDVLLVATNDPVNPTLLDALSLAAGSRVSIVLSPSEELRKSARKFYGVGADTVEQMLQDGRFEVSPEEQVGKIDLGELGQEASIVNFVNQIIAEADRQGATDIHVEPMEDELRIRYRIDGVLHKTDVPPQLNRFKAAITSRIKVMANLDIAEKRLPMDGRIGLRVQGQDLDIRVSTMPTVYGESVSLRLLHKTADFVGLRELGLGDGDRRAVEKIIRRPNGIVLVTGPTGSGKSTSLYAFLHEINTMDQRILTAEEPIEYEMAGVNQVLIQPEIGLTFAKALRSFLRQDPDIIMVGEIRDLETAEIAIHASLTGHLVFSTLHTNDAAGAFTRLIDMGVEPFLVASAVLAVVAQRLVRRLCKKCRAPASFELSSLRDAGFPVDRMDGRTIYESRRCEACSMTGFRGRIGLFELLQMTDGIEALVVARAATSEIKQKAIEQGMTTLRDDGWLKVLEGVTTLEEVVAATEENE